MLDSKQAIVLKVFLPERTLQTGISDVEQIPKVQFRSRNGVKFNGSLIPSHLKWTKNVATPPYLKGRSTGDMLPALYSVGEEDVKASSVCRLKE